jgi:S1-C subfamily serine protease
MKQATAIFAAVLLALLNGCQKDTSVSKILPTTAVETTDGISNSELFPGFDTVTNDTKNKYGCVGHVHNERGEFIGSGVLIAPSVILTAGHVIEGETLKFFITQDKCYIIEKTVIHPQYKVGEEIVNDLGLLFISDPCDEIPAVLIQNASELTQKEGLTTVGFSYNIKKISKPGTFWYYGTMEEEPQYMKFLPLKGHIWFGDSGGAVFEEQGHLAGIISSMTIVDHTLIEQSAIRVDRYLGWIQDTLEHEGCSFN